MKILSALLLLLLLSFYSKVFAQVNIDEFIEFRDKVKSIDYSSLEEYFPAINNTLYKGYNNTPDFSSVQFLDETIKQLDLTAGELQLLNQNHFFVSERLKSGSFGDAYHQIFLKDLPVFISSDFVLHALHSSYDEILKQIEESIIMENLYKFIQDLYKSCPAIYNSYQNKGVDKSLEDIDLYTAVAYSLISNEEYLPQFSNEKKYREVMEAIVNEKVVSISLFCNEERMRLIDFSQFKVRGHYTNSEVDIYTGVSLGQYFQAMMWLGRIDFNLISSKGADEEPWESEELKRINIDAFILNEMIFSSSFYSKFEMNNKIIDFMVGKSDNITPLEYKTFLSEQSIARADLLLDDKIFEDYIYNLNENNAFRQKILGGILLVNPNLDEPALLPVSYKVSGQRYIIDSEILTNVVFDRIVHKGEKIKRMMPNPLDALYVLGNSDALHLLKNEINEFHYAPNLATMKYMVDNQSDTFWESSLYNCWLGAIQLLNPVEDNNKQPFFMRTAAWHQQKMNTQLASWTQLRHDNLLYAKPSYTGGIGCSYPHSYIEPYPEFYKSLANFSERAKSFYKSFSDETDFNYIIRYYENFEEIMTKFELLAEKELNEKEFTANEQEWLTQFLYKIPEECGSPGFTGWINNFFYNQSKCIETDYLNVDIHTQPTDEYGNIVGKVFHTATGNINWGTFIIKHPKCNEYVAYTGAFQSYFENVTGNFLRLTDEEWENKILDNDIPNRPAWTKIYLANSVGSTMVTGPELPSTYLVGKNELDNQMHEIFIYPNPVSAVLKLDALDASLNFKFELFDISGRNLQKGIINGGAETKINFASYKKGLYLLQIQSKTLKKTIKIFKK